MGLRVGLGHDTHRLEPGGPLIVGGVTVPHDRQAVGHSDADVLLHAVTDALLGALALGDIGTWFPDTDPLHKGRNSQDFLEIVLREVRVRGYGVVNLDCTVHAQRPKLAPFREQIQARLATLLRVPADCVSIKAKTGERVGPIGREESIEAQAVVLLESVPPGSASTP